MTKLNMLTTYSKKETHMRWPGWHGGIRASPADNVHTKITIIYNRLV
jgi:hypothetical protein